MKEYTFDNIQEFYDGLNSSIDKYCVWLDHYEAEKKRKQEREIFENNYFLGIDKITIISEKFAVIKTYEQFPLYYAVIDNVANPHGWAYFEEAIRFGAGLIIKKRKENC